VYKLVLYCILLLFKDTVIIVLGTHDGYILVFNVPSNGRNIYLRETVNGNGTVAVVLITFITVEYSNCFYPCLFVSLGTE